jgi:5-methylcytosine-specific restriction endonuclease McrA
VSIQDATSNNTHELNAAAGRETSKGPKGLGGALPSLRHAAIMAMGGKCVRCGFDIEDALQIDHIIPIGQRRKGADVTYALLNSVIDGTAVNVQLLCANCHAIKTRREDAELRGLKPPERLPSFEKVDLNCLGCLPAPVVLCDAPIMASSGRSAKVPRQRGAPGATLDDVGLAWDYHVTGE